MAIVWLKGSNEIKCRIKKSIKNDKNDLYYYLKIQKVKSELRLVFNKDEANNYNETSELSKSLYNKFTPKIIKKIDKMMYCYSKISQRYGVKQAFIECYYIGYKPNNMFNDNYINIIHNDAQGFRNEEELIHLIKDGINMRDIEKKKKVKMALKKLFNIRSYSWLLKGVFIGVIILIIWKFLSHYL